MDEAGIPVSFLSDFVKICAIRGSIKSSQKNKKPCGFMFFLRLFVAVFFMEIWFQLGRDKFLTPRWFSSYE